VGEHVAAIDAVLRDLAPHVGRLPDGGASALAVLETALERSAAAVDKCCSLGFLGAMWHARDLKEEFQDAQQARAPVEELAERGGNARWAPLHAWCERLF
jgi:hypothetical protein